MRVLSSLSLPNIYISLHLSYPHDTFPSGTDLSQLLQLFSLSPHPNLPMSFPVSRMPKSLSLSAVSLSIHNSVILGLQSFFTSALASLASTDASINEKRVSQEHYFYFLLFSPCTSYSNHMKNFSYNNWSWKLVKNYDGPYFKPL